MNGKKALAVLAAISTLAAPSDRLVRRPANPQEVGLACLHSGEHDEEIGKKEAQ